MDKALLDYEVSIDADCKLLTVGKPFAIEGNNHFYNILFYYFSCVAFALLWFGIVKEIMQVKLWPLEDYGKILSD